MGELSQMVLRELGTVAAHLGRAIGINAPSVHLAGSYVILGVVIWVFASLLLFLFSGRVAGTLVWVALTLSSLYLGFTPWSYPEFLKAASLPATGSLPDTLAKMVIMVLAALILFGVAWRDSRRRTWRAVWFLGWLAATGLLFLWALETYPLMRVESVAAVLATVFAPMVAVGLPKYASKRPAPNAAAQMPAPPTPPQLSATSPAVAPSAGIPAGPYSSARAYSAPNAAPPRVPVAATSVMPVSPPPTATPPAPPSAPPPTVVTVSLPDSATQWSDFAPPVQPISAHEPQQIGHYRLLGRIGSGGMAIVYLAIDSRTNEQVAVKVANPMTTIDIQVQERMMYEIKALTSVSSQFIVHVRDTGMAGPYPFIAMDYLEGPSISTAVNCRGPVVDPTDLRRLALGTASGLAAIHDAGYTHRDIKPGNIVMTNGGPVIVDLGIAKLSGMSRELTGTGLVLGTIGFVAPELHRGQAATPAADVWSWGATVAYAATGQQLFGQGNPASTVNAILHGDRNRPVLDALAAIDRSLAATVWDATELSPDQRPQTGTQLLGMQLS